MAKPKASLEGLEPFFNKVGALSKIQRFAIYGGVFVIIIGVFVWFFAKPYFEERKKLKAKYEEVTKKLNKATIKANQLEAKRKEREAAQAQFELVKKTLPETEDIPNLVESISQAGREAGLDFKTFKPNPEIKRDFYAEIPISINVTGTYHDIAVFFDKVARLPRIVNIKNITINTSGATQQKGASQILSNSCTAVTYRFVGS